MRVRSAVTGNVTERTKGLLTLLNLHYAGVALLTLVILYLLIHMVVSWQAANSQDATALAQQRKAMTTAQLAAQPLAGLDTKLAQSREDADTFYQRRVPFAYSEVLGEMGVLAKRENVKLTRVQYAYGPVLDAASGPLTEVRMDASLSGDYRPLVIFMNGLERDKLFFLISGVTLTGQQSGTVNLRLKLTTYLRAPVGMEGLVPAVATPTATESAGAPL